MNLANMLDGLNQALGQANHGTDNMGQNVDLSSTAQLANYKPQNLENGIQVQLSSGDPDDVSNPVLTVMVETKSADDLMNSETGRQQMNQLSVQLEQAMNSLSQGVHMVHDLDQAEVVVDFLQDLKPEAMLGGIAELLVGQAAEQVLQGAAGVQSLQSLRQLMQTLDQLPALRGLLENVYRLLDSLQTSNPSTAKEVQQLLASATMSLQGMMMQVMGNGGVISGPEEVMQMLEGALQSLNTNMEMLNAMVYDMQQMMSKPTFLQAMNDTHCVVKSLTGEQGTGLALECMRQLLQSVVSTGSSEEVIAQLNNFITNFVNNPQLLQTFTDLMKMPNLDTAFQLIQMMAGNMNVAKLDLAAAMQTMQNMLKDLLGNQQLLETLTALMQNPEASTVYENAMGFLRNVTMGGPAAQQVLMVVNDTITRIWKDGDFRQVAGKIKEILTELTKDQDPIQPLSNAQKALVELLNMLLDFALSVNVTEPGESTTHPPQPTITPTLRPQVTSTVAETTKSSAGTTTDSPSAQTTPVHTASRASTLSTKTSALSTTDPGPRTSSTAPTTTRGMDTDDGTDNGATPVSLSGVTIIITVFALKVLA